MKILKLLLFAVVILVADLTNAGGAPLSGLAVSTAKHWAGLAPSLLAATSKVRAGDKPNSLGSLPEVAIGYPCVGRICQLRRTSDLPRSSAAAH